jgi:hypothetical protein
MLFLLLSTFKHKMWLVATKKARKIRGNELCPVFWTPVHHLYETTFFMGVWEVAVDLQRNTDCEVF